MEARVAFGPYVFDPASGALTCEGRALTIGGRGVAILGALAAADGAVVGKDALLAAAWPGIFVEEGNLTVQVARLRKLLGTRADGLDWIATVPRVGYRLLRDPGPAPVSDIPTLAVLPFANLGADPEQDYLADGIVDGLITGLSHFRSFAVISRNSSFAYKGRALDVRVVAAELGVQYVLEGSVRRAGDRLRVSAHLSDATSGAHLWAQSFDGGIEDVFEVQDRITETVATIVGPRIQQAEIARSRRERPASLNAYDLYLRALQKFNTRRIQDNTEAVVLLERAIALDPGFAAALATAASAYEHRVTVGWPPVGADDRKRSLELARLALDIGHDDATVLSMCGMVLIFVGQEHDRGLSTVMLAVETNPYDERAVTCAGVANILSGDLDQALDYFGRVLRLSPLDALTALCGIAHVEICRGNYEAALASATRALAMNPGFAVPNWMVIAANVYLGRQAEAERALAAYRASAPQVTLSSLRAGPQSRDPSRMGVILEGLRLAGMPER